jgi:ABC-type Na+ efflux pump permease subunit
MPVVLTQEVEGLNVGDTYTGPREAWLLAEGYADQAGYDTNVAANLVGGSNAVNIVTGGAVVIQVGDEVRTATLADGDTPAAAATKIDTALAGVADAAIVSSKLEVTSTALGYDVLITVQSGAGTTLANLGLTAGQQARGTDGGAGVSNTGPVSVAVASNPTFDATRGNIATDGGLPEAATNDNLTTKAYPAPTTHYVGPLA